MKGWLYVPVFKYAFDVCLFYYYVKYSLVLFLGGFSQMYACVCDWLGFPYREEVQWVSTCLVLELISTNCTNDVGADKS